MMTWSGVDLIAASALAMALFGALLLLAIITRSRDELLASPVGWRLVATALSLFALRGLFHFVPVEATDQLEHVVGIGAATVLPLGLFLVLRASDQGVGADG